MANFNPTGLLPATETGYNAPIPGYFPGQAVAGLSPWTQSSWGQGMGAAGNVAQAGNEMLNRWQTGFDMGMMGNPWLDAQVQNMQNQGYQNYNRNTRPAIEGGAIAAGQPGSTRQGIAEGVALGDLNRSLNDATANMYGNAYNQQLGHTRGMTGQMPGILNQYGQSAMTPFNMMQGIGNQQRGYNQELLNAEKGRWDYSRDMPWQRLSQMGQIFGGLPISNTSKSDQSGFNFGWGGI